MQRPMHVGRSLDAQHCKGGAFTTSDITGSQPKQRQVMASWYSVRSATSLGVVLGLTKNIPLQAPCDQTPHGGYTPYLPPLLLHALLARSSLFLTRTVPTQSCHSSVCMLAIATPTVLCRHKPDIPSTLHDQVQHTQYSIFASLPLFPP